MRKHPRLRLISVEQFIMAELSIPVATIVGAEMVQDASLKHSTICESIKSLRDNYMEFCEDEDEFIETIVPIDQDPEPYANGTKKTRPILKKYAQALVDKKDLEEQLEAEAEAQRDVHLTPQQVKADMKIYVSSCEKKIAKQQEQCEQLQEHVKQLTDVVNDIFINMAQNGREHGPTFRNKVQPQILKLTDQYKM